MRDERFTEAFWAQLEQLVATSKVVVERPRGSEHPRWPGAIYPLDYGYVEGTTGGDGQAIDVWIGSQGGEGVTGIVCALDLHKRDLEVKVLLGCSADERQTILGFHNHREGPQHAVLVERGGPARSPSV